jgi:hypothetical protein
MPLRSLAHGWKHHIANERQGAVSRIGPWDLVGQELHDFPAREKLLNSIDVGEFQWAENQARCRYGWTRSGHSWLALQTGSVTVVGRISLFKLI